MKKLFLVLLVLSVLLAVSCDDNKNSSAVTNTVISKISEIESYSYIGTGVEESSSRSLKDRRGKKILGIRKADGRAEPVRFRDRDGNEIPSSPSVTAELVTDGFTFYKLSYSSADYYDSDFKSADGNMYVISKNGDIYYLEGISFMYGEIGNYDYYDGLFVGSFRFDDGSEYMCKVYLNGSELKIEKKINIDDFPDFKNVFIDSNKNIFACEKTMNDRYFMSSNLTIKHILSNKGKIYSTIIAPHEVSLSSVMLTYSRVVYMSNSARVYNDNTFEYNDVSSLREYLSSCYLINNRIFKFDKDKYDIEEQSDGTVHFTIKEGTADYYKLGSEFTGTAYYKDLDIADTPDFIPPELAYAPWSRANNGPYHNWYYSRFLGIIDDSYVYITEDNNHDKYFACIVKVKYSENNPLEYTVNFCPSTTEMNSTTETWGDEISLDWLYSDGKIYYFRENTLRVVDIEKETNTVFSNSDIVRYHSIEKVNNNKVGFQGTNSYGKKVYYEIDPTDNTIELIGTTPTYSSVSFNPINK